jgi:hypothetical protein
LHPDGSRQGDSHARHRVSDINESVRDENLLPVTRGPPPLESYPLRAYKLDC